MVFALIALLNWKLKRVLTLVLPPTSTTTNDIFLHIKSVHWWTLVTYQHINVSSTVSTFSTFNKPILDVLVYGTRFIITLHRISVSVVSCECFCRNNMTTGVTRIARVEPYEIAMLFFSNLLPHMVWQLVESFALTCAQARTRSIGSCVSFVPRQNSSR